MPLLSGGTGGDWWVTGLPTEVVGSEHDSEKLRKMRKRRDFQMNNFRQRFEIGSLIVRHCERLFDHLKKNS